MLEGGREGLRLGNRATHHFRDLPTVHSHASPRLQVIGIAYVEATAAAGTIAFSRRMAGEIVLFDNHGDAFAGAVICGKGR